MITLTFSDLSQINAEYLLSFYEIITEDNPNDWSPTTVENYPVILEKMSMIVSEWADLYQGMYEHFRLTAIPQAVLDAHLKLGEGLDLEVE